MYKEIVINGKYMCKKECRGVQRYTKEVLHAMDKLPEASKIKVIIPHKVNSLDKFENIQVVQFGGYFTSKFWQVLGFQVYLWRHHAFSICLSDGVPFWNIGIAAVHDIRYFDDLKKKMPFKIKMGLLFTKKGCDKSVIKSKELVTVSQFSKNEILKQYNINPNKISVCYNSWEHLKRVGFSDDIFSNNPRIKKGDYYFMLGGNEESKNMYWILKMVQKYTDRLFVMAGPKNLFFPSENVDLSQYKNFIHIGYVTDEELKSLMKECKAFLFPSKYEGFGIPPMEAISVGAKAFVSNATCLPEVYKKYVSYFDPEDYNVDLDLLYNDYPENSVELLKEYSWKKTARSILELAKKYVEA